MINLASLTPYIVDELRSALASIRREEFASQLETGVIERCSYDETVDCGYVYFVRPAPSLHFAKLATPIAETISFMDIRLNLDIDHDGNVYGIEFLGRADFITDLKRAKWFA